MMSIAKCCPTLTCQLQPSSASSFTYSWDQENLEKRLFLSRFGDGDLYKGWKWICITDNFIEQQDQTSYRYDSILQWLGKPSEKTAYFEDIVLIRETAFFSGKNYKEIKNTMTTQKVDM